MTNPGAKRTGIPFAILSAITIGFTPVFGKLALQGGIHPMTLVVARTWVATLLLFLALLLYNRSALSIHPIGLAGCSLAGLLNGIGSLFFYAGLNRIDASLGQLIYSLYPIVVAILLFLDGQRPDRLTLFALLLSLPAIYLLTYAPGRDVDPVGVIQMLAAGILYALHIPINQRVLYEAPAPTVTLYTMSAMAIVVLPAFLLASPTPPLLPAGTIGPLLGLALMTFISRISLFAGVKSIGGMPTALFGLGQLLVTMLLAFLWLGETLTFQQWAGAGILCTALFLTGKAPSATPLRSIRRGWLAWLHPASKKRPPAAHSQRLARPSKPDDIPHP